MRAYVITLDGHKYSEACAERCLKSAAGVEPERFGAVTPDIADREMARFGLRWTWANGNTAIAYCPITGLRQHPYGRLGPKKACFMSHYLLWLRCAESGEPLLILEHDAVFVRPFEPFDFDAICQINDPRGATPHGAWWSDQMALRGAGVWPKTWVREGREIPDGLAGNSAYLIKPHAAQALMDRAAEVGVWPNDALMCAQLFPYLQEAYPFITRVEQKASTSS